ncbi:MAG: DUF4332 domain-containing protein [Candidatus Heimdallarchaeota archaeon]|nr:DUF4332 domain-containing protein [Candidatus Heimdallarchaeota archaeon]
MEIDWEKVEKLVKPSTSFDFLVKSIKTTLTYNFVRENYNLSMRELQEYTQKLLGSDPRQRYNAYLENINSVFRKLEKLDVTDVVDLISLTENKYKFAEFYKKSNISLEGLVRVYKYFFNWFLPSKGYLRELVEKENDDQIEYTTILRKYGIRFTLDILDRGRTRVMRKKIAVDSGIPEDFILELVNKADFTRMPYIKGKSINHYFSIGYNNLEKLSKANLGQLESEMRDYLKKKGIKLSSSFIELDSGIEIAKILCKLIVD